MSKESFWQVTRADGNPDWPTGTDGFELMWDRAFEHLKFHRGSQFTITNEKTGETGPKLNLGKEVPDHLKNQLQEHPDVVFRVRSEADHFALAFKRHVVELKTKGEQFLNIGRELMGTRYDWGGTNRNGVDCSGLVMYESDPFGIHYSEHRAYTMWQEFKAGKDGKITIPRSKILKGDLLIIHGGAHIATYIDDQDGGRVLDAEPGSAQNPWGWVPGGVQVRSMAPNYYCAWANVNDVCRLTQINGPE